VSNVDDLSVYLYMRQTLKLTFPFLHVILLIAVYEYLQQPKRILFWLAIGFFVITNFLIIFGVLKGGYYIFIIYSLLIINYIFLIRQSIKQKKQEGNALKKAGYLFLLILAIAFAVSIVVTIVLATTILKQSEMNDYLLIFVSLFIILLKVGPQFSVSAATSFTLAKQYVKTSNSLKEKLIEVEILSNEKQQLLSTQNQLLENQVKERTLDLEKSLNDLKSTQQQLIQSEKLASLGELTAGIAHEIQNPLNFVNNFSELSSELIDEMNEEIEKEETEEVKAIASDLKMNLQKINHHGKRASSIVKGMLEHSRASTGVKELTDINALADEYLRLAYHGLRAKDKTFNSDFKTDFDENLPKIAVNPQDFSRVLLNLFNNAFYAVTAPKPPMGASYSPKVTISTEYVASPSGAAVIRVTDNGTGMSEATKAKIFQPFFTTKPTGQGTGLGLSLAYDIITKGHGGTIDVETKEGEGTTFIIKLPIQ
jgi:two-component system, NtrC family, sensor kinase